MKVLEKCNESVGDVGRRVPECMRVSITLSMLNEYPGTNKLRVPRPANDGFLNRIPSIAKRIL